jgi:hypothetical protein
MFGKTLQPMKTHIQLIVTDSEYDDFEDLGHEPARKHAHELAHLLDGKVLDNPQRIAVNEPLRPFMIPLRVEQFQTSLYVSSSDYSFRMEHRKRTAAIKVDAMFCVSFKNQDRTMFTKDRVAAVSKALGVPVYRQGFVENETVARYLLCDSVSRCLLKIDFQPINRLFLSPIQLIAVSELKDPTVCVSQIRLFMKLMDSLACARKPDKSKRTGK